MDARSFQEKAKVRDAILRAASHIERRPDEYRFWSDIVPPCGSPGCMLGLIGTHLGLPVGTYNREVATALGVHSTGEFYERMWQLPDFSGFHEPALIAKSLRRYADKYHPASTLDPSFVKYRDGLVREFAMDAQS